MEKIVKDSLPKDLNIRLGAPTLDLLMECCNGEAPPLTMQTFALTRQLLQSGMLTASLLHACTPAEFVQLVASEANTVSEEEKKKTINPEHVVSALERLGLAPFLDDVNATWSEVKESEQSRSELRKAHAGNCPVADGVQCCIHACMCHHERALGHMPALLQPFALQIRKGLEWDAKSYADSLCACADQKRQASKAEKKSTMSEEEQVMTSLVAMLASAKCVPLYGTIQIEHATVMPVLRRLLCRRSYSQKHAPGRLPHQRHEQRA